MIKKPCDVVIELIGGTETANDLITRALRLGRHVVTANKALFASEVEKFENLAAANDASVRYGAAVGGAMSALETVSRAGKLNNLRSVSGILNGTCNFICDELAKGSDFAAAVEAARKAGFTEADPELDLNGTDAAQKLILLARLAFGAHLPLAAIRREGIENLDAAQVKKAIEKGNVVRLVAECRRTTSGIEASVKPIELPASHPFAQTRGADNCLLLETVEGEIEIVRGAGAGLAPFEAWLLLRGVKTLALRVERQTDSARKIAEFLARHERVERVFYPGLDSHHGFDINERQAKGGGAVVSFTTGDARISQMLAESTKLFDIAVSFGSVGSVISLPCRMSHKSVPEALGKQFAPPADLVRVSIGIEDVGDLIEDLSEAFGAIIKKAVSVSF